MTHHSRASIQESPTTARPDLATATIRELIVELAQAEYAIRGADRDGLRDTEVAALADREQAVLGALRERQLAFAPVQPSHTGAIGMPPAAERR